MTTMKQRQTTTQRINRPSRTQERGSSMVEFGLMLGGFLLLTFGLIDLARGVWTYHTLAHATREAVRYAMVRGGTSEHPASATEITGVVRTKAAGLHPQQVNVTATWSPDNNPGSTVRIQAQCVYKTIMPLMPSLTIPLQSSSEMVIAY